jgi:hypothetical protein
VGFVDHYLFRAEQAIFSVLVTQKLNVAVSKLDLGALVGLALDGLDNFAELGFEAGANVIDGEGVGEAADKDLRFCVPPFDVDFLLANGEFLEGADLINLRGRYHEEGLELALLLAERNMFEGELELREGTDDERFDLKLGEEGHLVKHYRLSFFRGLHQLDIIIK